MSVELHHSCRAWPWLAGPIFLAFVAVGGALGCDAEEPAEPDASSVHPAVVPTPRSDAHSRERRAAIRERALSGDPVRLVLLGDSITERRLVCMPRATPVLIPAAARAVGPALYTP